jgi:hypothetical protein
MIGLAARSKKKISSLPNFGNKFFPRRKKIPLGEISERLAEVALDRRPKVTAANAV